MAFAITLKALNDTADPLRALSEKVAHLESRPSMGVPDYPPHVTLAIYNNVPLNRIRKALSEVIAVAAPLRLTFTGLRLFENAPLVLWAEPSTSEALAGVHAKVHACIEPVLCHPHYRPGTWVPHCTLASQIRPEDRARAAAFAARQVQAFEVVFDVADCVSFPPVTIIDERPLAGRE
jgi:2'-5' RNA ligase